MKKGIMEEGELEEGEIEEEEPTKLEEPKLSELFGSKDCDWRLAAPQPFCNSFPYLEPFPMLYPCRRLSFIRGRFHHNYPPRPLSHQESYEELVNKYWRLQKELRSIEGRPSSKHLSHPHSKNFKKNCKKKYHSSFCKKHHFKSPAGNSRREPILDEEDPKVLELRKAALESRTKLGTLLKKFKEKNKENVSADTNSEERRVPDVNTRIMDMEISDSEAMSGFPAEDSFMPLEDIDEMLEEDYLRAEAINSLKQKLSNSSQEGETTNPPLKRSRRCSQSLPMKAAAPSIEEEERIPASEPEKPANPIEEKLNGLLDSVAEIVERPQETKSIGADSKEPVVEEGSKNPVNTESKLAASSNSVPAIAEVATCQGSPILVETSRSNSPVVGVVPAPKNRGWWVAPTNPKTLVINLDEDDDDNSTDTSEEFKADVENFLVEARENTKASPMAPAVAPLSKAQQTEYLRLKKEIQRRERSKPNFELKKKLLLRKSQEAKAKLDNTKERMKKDAEELHAVRCEMEACKKDILAKKKEVTLLQRLILQHNSKLAQNKLRFRKLTEKSAKLATQIKIHRTTVNLLQTECTKATKMAADFTHTPNNHEVNNNKSGPPKVQKPRPEVQTMAKNILHTLAPWVLPLPPPFSLPSLESIQVPSEHPSHNPVLPTIEGSASYLSPLHQLASSRLDPTFPPHHLSSTHFVHSLDPMQSVCRFDLLGSCNNPSCKWQHSKDYVPSDNAILRNLLSYSPQLAGVLKSDSRKLVLEKMDQYLGRLHKQHPDKPLDDLCAILAKQVSAALADDNVLLPRSKVPTCNSAARPPISEESTNVFSEDWRIKKKPAAATKGPGSVEEEDNAAGSRYFALDRLPQQQQPQQKLSTGELEEALSSLSSALENNRTDPRLWSDYLGLYCQHPDSSKDLPSLCLQATSLCPHPTLFWKCLEVVEPWDTKTKLCQRLVGRLMAQDPPDSDQLLGAALYLTNLQRQVCPSSAPPPILKTLAAPQSPLNLQDRVFLWLCILALECFVKYPCRIFSFDLTLSSKKPFMLPWRCVNPDMSQKSVLELFEKALDSCGSCSSALLPLLENLLNLEMIWSRDKETSLCLRQLDKMEAGGFSSPELWRFVVKAHTWWNLPLDNMLLPPHPLPWHALAVSARADTAQQEAILCAYLGHCFILPQADSSLPALELYRELLGLPSSLQSPPERRNNGLRMEEESCRCYMWLNYLMLLHAQLGGWCSRLEEGYERALCSVVDRNSQEAIWCQYLMHGASVLGGSLVRRSLHALSSHQDMQLNLLIWYLKTIDQDSLAAKEALSLAYSWPQNPWLLERAVCLLLDCSDFHTAFTLLTSTRRSATFSLNLYKVAIFLSKKTSDSQQVHFWFDRALQAYPYNALLWKLCLQYEISLGHTEHIKHLMAEGARLKIPGLGEIKGPSN